MKKTIDALINQLLQYGLEKNLITLADIDYCRNLIMAQLQLHEIDTEAAAFQEAGSVSDPSDILNPMLDWAYENGRLENNTVTERDLLDTKIIACFIARPTEIIRQFTEIEQQQGPEAATQWFYEFSKNSHYIRQDRIRKNVSWTAPTEYGELEITINLSKPEKDPKEIAAAKQAEQSNYPLCLLCKENEGYAGRLNHPARQNLRTIPLQLNEEEWRLQFSPYVYYHEHAIIFSAKHKPMKISALTFKRLLDVVERFPHYFVGSNADLPIVGGSILTHDHYQGGFHEFPMAVAGETVCEVPALSGVRVGKVKWPMSVLRITGKEKEQVITAAEHIRKKWQTYSDPSVEIIAFTGETPHNTVTPIARMKDGQFQLDIVLRNNRTNDEHPDGIFHPHAEVHPIKRENIGLIEVMGLAVFPGRLVEEMKLTEQAMLSNNMEKAFEENEKIRKHKQWAEKIVASYENLSRENCAEILRTELGKTFAVILEHAGVFKRDDEGQAAFDRFIHSL
ncbi:UDPglucose--hexose-1-phosphate uridylyltransferase [Evansella caseinilytica]|uniref:Galactose-1-phosphate uridylyltransferase n=1 Tax=Evansella caseinilytica TaxID=1503961 RepID=A0A1H3QFS0_9BACI|nr:UDP-glucose--hexose-1-phosphate uridylyltransferase [Evansella caseinilytica]SDZ11991.1 UDPglucose--hexose-1-phosphate uridylyltransferase [Evansella caseinilytica]